MTSSENTGFAERVPPRNGRRETRGMLLALMLILGISGTGVLLNQAPQPEPARHLSLNTAEKSLLTQLSSAASEIRFMAQASGEDDVVWPDIAALQAVLLPPFASETSSVTRWQNPVPGCYIGQSAAGGHTFLLLMPALPDKAAQIYTRARQPASAPCESEHWQHQLSEF